MIGNLKQKAKSKAATALENAPIPTDLVMNVLRRAPVPMKVTDLVESTGLDKSIVDRALAALSQEGRISSPEKDCYAVV